MKKPKKISSISTGRAAKGQRETAEKAMEMSNRLAGTAFTNARLEGGNIYQGTAAEKMRAGKNAMKNLKSGVARKAKKVVALAKAKKNPPKGK